MASLERIERLTERLDDREPSWVRGYRKRDNHLSGALRDIEERMSDPDISLDDIELEIRQLLEEAAETLDDAHENWLDIQLAARDVCGDVGAMRQDENWFGGFEQHFINDYGNAVIEWPNVEITITQLADVLDGKEYKL